MHQGFYGPTSDSIAAYYGGLRDHWHAVMKSSDLSEGVLQAVELLEESVLLVRLDGQLVAMQNLCRHYQEPLSLGCIVNVNGASAVRCNNHGWAFGPTGRCVQIPQLIPGRGVPNGAVVPTYKVEERYGMIWVCLGNPMYPILDFPELTDLNFLMGEWRTYDPWECSIPTTIMMGLDRTHLAYVHDGLLGDSTVSQLPPPHRVWRDGQFVIFQYTMIQPPNPTVSQDEGGAVTYTVYVALPGIIRITKDSGEPLPDGGNSNRYVIYLLTSPHRFNLTNSIWRIGRNFEATPEQLAADELFEDGIRAQDKPFVEAAQRWRRQAMQKRASLPVMPADEALMEYEAALAELGIPSEL